MPDLKRGQSGSVFASPCLSPSRPVTRVDSVLYVVAVAICVGAYAGRVAQRFKTSKIAGFVRVQSLGTARNL